MGCKYIQGEHLAGVYVWVRGDYDVNVLHIQQQSPGSAQGWHHPNNMDRNYQHMDLPTHNGCQVEPAKCQIFTIHIFSKSGTAEDKLAIYSVKKVYSGEFL